MDTRRWDHKQSVKEVVRHLLYTAGLFKLLQRRRIRRGFKTAHLQAEDRAARFRQIYEIGVWRHEDGQEAGSGLGSELSRTNTIRTDLPRILSELGVETLVDVGCGDWTWMSHVTLPCRYVGLDIVPEVVDRNTERFASDTVSFRHLDAVTQELPRCDAVLCREVLFHLSFEDARRLLDNIARNAVWMIVTTDSGVWFNSNIPSGDFRPVNLQRPPFSFGAPAHWIMDDELVAFRRLGVWPISGA